LKYVFVFAIILFIPFVSAQLIVQSVSSSSIGLQPTFVNATIVNPTSTNYVNVNISNTVVGQQEIFNITANSNLTKLLSWIPATFGNFQHVFTVKYFQPTIINLPGQNVNIFANPSGLSNPFVTVLQNSNIVILNNFSSNISLVDNRTSIASTIIPTQSATLSYTEIGMFAYIIEPAGYVGYVNVTTPATQSFIYDPTLDRSFSWTVQSAAINQNLSIALLTPNISIAHNSSGQAVLQITVQAPGSIVFSASPANWVSFQHNDIFVSTSHVEVMTVTPHITSTTQTNTTHSIALTVNDAVGTQSTVNLQVFVPFADIDSENETLVNGTIVIFASEEHIAAFCKAFPNKCPTQNITQVQFINRSPTDIERTIQEIELRSQRLNNQLDGFSTDITNMRDSMSTMRVGFDTLKGSVEQQVQQRTEELEQLKTAKLIRRIFIGLSIFILAISASTILAWKWYKAQQFEGE